MDADQSIELRLGCSIRAFFEQEGESAFRDVEQDVIDELTGHFRGVLATGGGAVLREVNRIRLRERCRVIYLRSRPEEVFRRTRHDVNRPLLQVNDPMRRLRELFEQRDPLYREAAHFVVDTGRPSVNAVVRQILERVGGQPSEPTGA